MEFIVHGKRAAAPTGDDFAELYGSDFASYRTRADVKVAGVRGGDVAPIRLDGEGSDVVEVEDVEGVVSFHRADQLVRAAGDTEVTDYLESATRARGAGAGLAAVRRVEVTLPQDIAEKMRAVDRAVGVDVDRSGLLGAGLGMVADPLVTWTARKLMREVVDWIDKPVGVDAPVEVWRRKPKPRGVYRVDPELRLQPEALLNVAAERGNKPCLVFLHGTFSHTEGAFGALRGTAEWQRLVETYEDRILAVEHATLGLTPAENALMAAEFLPENTPLHLVSHSRGGLVGEVLSYAAAYEPNLNPYGELEHPDRVALPKLRELVAERNLSVERFVRVACPARGTTLAAHRLDRWASFLFNVFKLVPVLSETGTAALIKKFLMTVLEQRTDPRIVPGIEAQMPESPFLRMLLSGRALKDGLGSIAGDVQASGIRRRLLVMGADLFFRQDHDFVVPTSSMSGGVRRATPSSASFKGADVSHGTYFSNVDSRKALLGWLTATAGQRVASFEEPVAPVPPAPERGGRVEPKCDVIVVPDLLGSRIRVGEVDTWPDVGALVREGVRESFAGEAVDLVDAYVPLTTALATQHNVRTLPYAAAESPAERLAGELRAVLAENRTPHVVAHGLGALVVLEALNSGDLREQWRAAEGRAVLLGPPLQGSWLVRARLAGRDEFTATIALLAGTTPAEVGTWLAEWPTMELLQPRDVVGDEDWTGISAVYGSAELTASASTDSGEFTCSTGGDGFAMPGRVPGLATWHAVVPHADLPGDRDVAVCVLELLAGRTPTRLLSSAPAVMVSDRNLPDSRGRMLLPTDGEIVRMAWGGGSRAADRQVLRVSVVHGDLESVPGPVLVGHQDGTPVGGAEQALNERLNGALKRRLDMRQYPGPLGTCEVFDSERSPAGVVIGIGDAGDLTPRALTASVIQAVLRLVAEHQDRGSEEPLSLSAVLVGTTLVPAMPVENSLIAIVTGVRQANRKLRDLRSLVFVDELKIVELYEDRAIQAARAAIGLAGTLKGDGASDVVVEGRLLEGGDGRRGMPRPEYHDDTWRTVRIVAADPGRRTRVADGLVELSFTSIGRDAGAQQRVNTSQRRLLDELVAEAVDKPVQDDQLFNTLYEMLVPNALKEQGYGSEHLSVVVDEQAGVLPLEMLASRTPDEGVLPLAVQVGVLRRLETRTATEGIRPSSGRAALVIGDPAGTGLNRLPAARREAEHVRDLLHRTGYEVTAIIPGPDADEDVVGILNALFARDYRIIHIAGHGNYDPKDVTRGGVRIGRDTYLGPLEIAKMRTTPDLVFVNCCHLGAMRPRSLGAKPLQADRFASSISRQLVENGVRAVIAAGWAVDDKAALVFAETLFGDLLSGRDLGAAALAARKKVYEDFKWTNTWGAYQVYGPPAFRLDPARSRTSQLPPPVARRELTDRLYDLKRRATNCQVDEGIVLGEDLETLLKQVPPSWLGGQELSDVGEVWGLLANYRKAVEYFLVVQADWASEGSLRAIEQLVNMQAKLAVELVVQSDDHVPEARKLLAKAEATARALLTLGATPERHSMLGGLARRRARCALSDDGALIAALVTARDCYQAAVELNKKKTGKVDYYPALNELVFGWLANLRDTGQPFDKAHAKSVIKGAREEEQAGPKTFWSGVRAADALLAEALVDNKLRVEQEHIRAAYEDAFAESSGRDRATVLEHVDTIAQALPDKRKRDAAVLRQLRDHLKGVTCNGRGTSR
ncbi:DUF7379 domain-containing protein [Lentzea sp. NPDC054927]